MTQPANLPIDLTPDDLALISNLLSENQGHLFEKWDPSGEKDEEKSNFLQKLKSFDRGYPGGLTAYIQKARRLLSDAQKGQSPFDGYSISTPEIVDLTRFDESYLHFEEVGATQFDHLAVVLVAGGLGERLGYNGIKVDIPLELVESKSYLANICDFLLAAQDRTANKKPVPLLIMTSDQTHNATKTRFEKENYFGLKKDQVTLLRQTLVPSLSDVDGHLALKEKYHLHWKPNGHGAVHQMLYASGATEKLIQEDVRYLAFVQDTNAQIFNALPAALGAAEEKNFDFVSTAVQRVPKEACGALVKLTQGERALTTNVEYNQLDALLSSSGHAGGDVASADGFSPYPGNVNGLLIRAESYFKVLKKTEGMVPEFANPKFADAKRSTFKEPARLETMMQDLPQLFESGERVGVALFHRQWCFSPLKNRLEASRIRHKKGLPPECAGSAESDFYLGNRMKCRFAGVAVEDPPHELVSDIPFQKGARVILRPSFALSLQEVQEKISGGSFGKNATVLVDGRNVHLKNISVSEGSTLEIHAVEGAEVWIEDLTVSNRGCELQELTAKELSDPKTPEYLQIRGYQLSKGERLLLRFDKPGRYRVGSDGKIQPLDSKNA